MIGIGLGNGFVRAIGNGLGHGYGTIGNRLENCRGNGIATGKVIGTGIGMYIDWAGLFRKDPRTLSSSPSIL
jgi:hypothetical protein